MNHRNSRASYLSTGKVVAVILVIGTSIVTDDCFGGPFRWFNRRRCGVRRVRCCAAPVTPCCAAVGDTADADGVEPAQPRSTRPDSTGKPDEPTAPTDATAPEVAEQKGEPAWKDLFDGRSLKNWKSTNFGGEGEVYVEEGKLMLEFGSPMTGVTYAGADKLPTRNYEARVEAMRVDGTDFFCGFTFPVNDSFCSFIVGGWGGGVIGLSSIDDRDASENDTTDYMAFTNGKWYRIRVRVTDERIQAWIDDVQKVDQDLTGHTVSTRLEVELSQPFGIAVYDTRAALRNLQIRRLTDEEIQAASEK